MAGTRNSATTIEKAARHLGLPDEIEAINVSPDEGTDYWRVDVNIGWADEMIADLLISEDIAFGIAHALDLVYSCGVYDQNGNLR